MADKNAQELRRAAREVLACRPGVALDLRGIRRRIEKDNLFDGSFLDEDLSSALAMLEGLSQLKSEFDPLGSTRRWKATSEGVLAFERGQ